MPQDNFMYEWRKYKEHYDLLDDGKIKIHDDAPLRIKESYQLYHKLMYKVNTFTNQKTSLFSMPSSHKEVKSHSFSDNIKENNVFIKTVLDYESKKKIATRILNNLKLSDTHIKTDKCAEFPFWSANENKEEVAFICVNKISEASIEIYAIAVLNDYQQIKIGTLLLKECEAWCSENSIKLIKCMVKNGTNDSLYKFCTVNGFYCLEKMICEDFTESLVMVKCI